MTDTPDKKSETSPDLNVTIKLQIDCAAKMVPTIKEVLAAILVIDESVIRDSLIRVTSIDATYTSEAP